MKVTDFLENKNKTHFSFEIIPPFRGGSIDKVFSLVEDLMRFDPPFIDLTSRSAEEYYQDDGDGNLVQHIRRKRPGTIGMSAAIKISLMLKPYHIYYAVGFLKKKLRMPLLS